MTDYECFPLWSGDPDFPVYNIDPEDLPISEHLRKALINWARIYDATLDRSDPARSGFATDDERLSFNNEGRALARRLASELGETSRVLLWDEATGTAGPL